MERTKVGSILTVAVALVSRPRPFSSSLRKRVMMSLSVSSEKRMEYRYLSIWGAESRGTGEDTHPAHAHTHNHPQPAHGGQVLLRATSRQQVSVVLRDPAEGQPLYF